MSFINLERKNNTVVCKYCGKTGLQWVKSVNTKSGVELKDKDNILHNCQNRPISEYFETWTKFFKNRVVWENDEKRDEKIEKWKKTLGVDESGLTYTERLIRDRSPEEIENWKKFEQQYKSNKKQV